MDVNGGIAGGVEKERGLQIKRRRSLLLFVFMGESIRKNCIESKSNVNGIPSIMLMTFGYLYKRDIL